MTDDERYELIKKFSSELEAGAKSTTIELEEELSRLEEVRNKAQMEILEVKRKIQDGEDICKFEDNLITKYRGDLSIVRIVESFISNKQHYGIVVRATKTRVNIELLDDFVEGYGISYQYMRGSGYMRGGKHGSKFFNSFILNQDLSWINRVYDDKGKKIEKVGL